MNHEIWIYIISLTSFACISLLVWALFRYPIPGETPINRQIAVALGLGMRQTLFEALIIGQLLKLVLIIAGRFPFCRNRIRQDLEASGNPNGYTVEEYLAICLSVAMVVFAVCFVLLAHLGTLGALALITIPFIGFIIPLWALHDTASKRVIAIARQLPYTLDLIALLIQAGASFTQAITTLIRDNPNDELNHELQLVQSEISVGSSRSQALANLGKRIPLDSLRSVIGAINQAEALGTPLSTILKNQSDILRNRRSVLAEEAGAKASLRILIPSMLILLAVVLVLFAPMLITWITTGKIL